MLLKQHFLATKPTICVFVASRFRMALGAAVQNYIAGVWAQHVAVNAPWLLSPQLHLILEGDKCNHPTALVQPDCIEVKIKHLRVLADVLPCNVFGWAIFAAACVAFQGQFWLGKLLTTLTRTWSLKHIPSCAAWVSLNIDTILLPWTKTKISKGAWVPIMPQESCTCPVSALPAYACMVPTPPSVPLFCYPFGPMGMLCPLTKQAFLTCINTVFHNHGLPKVTGHCFWIGGTTELLSWGMPPEIVQVAGCWILDSHLLYWRKHKAIIPQHIKNIVILARCP
jgi:hypothetical protein